MAYRSAFADIAIPQLDLWTFLFDRSDAPFPPDHVLLIGADTHRSYTFVDLQHLSSQFGKGIVSQWGWKRGDVLAVYAPNSIDVPPAMLGVLWAGGVVCPVNTGYTASELAAQLRDSGARGVATCEELLGRAKEAAGEVGISNERVILLGDGKNEEVRNWREVMDRSRMPEVRKTRIEPNRDTAFIVYSSGTTGLPKGVALTHYNVVANILQVGHVERQHLSWEADSQLGVLPFFHIYGLAIVVLGGLHGGIKTILGPIFEPTIFCSLIQSHRITHAYVPPPIVLALAKHPSIPDYDLSSLRFLSSAAAPLRRELACEVWGRLGVAVKQGYGLSEAGPAVMVQAVNEFWRFAGSVGRLLPNMRAKIVGEDGEEVKDGEAGELLLKGPNIFSGYLNRREMNREIFTDDGYYRTGDIVHRDNKGNYYITDRVKEIIKYNGFQVAPAELEGLLLSRPDIADACVIGTWDTERQTEVPRAYVVPRAGVPGDKALAKDIVEWLAGQTAPHKRLRGGVRFVEGIPKSAAGKVLRRVLKGEEKGETRAKL